MDKASSLVSLILGAGRLSSADDAARAAERCESIRLRWRDRLHNCSRDMRAWQPLIELRAMALAPLDQMEV